ncbi:hypothetical protein FRB99_004515 [Tulasnella sp. 403]|nr:hypothetical protein FRB99_004515 [Tulasnella sp. 403]
MDFDRYKEDGTKVHSWQFYPQLNTQRWDLIDKGGYYCIKNVGMQTYLHLQNGSSENNVEAQISSFTEGNDNQLWFLDRLSRSADEIRSILRGNPIMSEVSDQTITYYDNVQYLVLPNRLRESAYSISGLEKRMRREGLFDFEDFNIKLRDAITTWGNDHIALDGCRILFGIVHGSCEGQLYPYSWTLTEDCRSVVFFDAYLGKELTAASLGELGFKARFAVF